MNDDGALMPNTPSYVARRIRRLSTAMFNQETSLSAMFSLGFLFDDNDEYTIESACRADLLESAEFPHRLDSETDELT
jgi:hypothetical protein